MYKKKYRIHYDTPVEFVSYEKAIANFLWAIILLLILSDAHVDNVVNQAMVNCNKIILQVVLYIILSISNLIKKFRMKEEKLNTGSSCKYLKFADILIICLLISTLKYGLIFCFIVFVPMVSICITKGFRASMPYMFFAMAAQFISFFFMPFIVHNKEYVLEYYSLSYVLFFINIYLVFIALFRIIGIYNNHCTLREQDNQKLVSELKTKYEQLEQARIERQEQFDKLKEVNLRLEDMNKKLDTSLAEFFTLQQISQAIGSIFDVNELLKHVNDIIIGVMGVATSNIALYNNAGNRLKIQVTNISNARERAILTDNINSPELKKALDEGRTIMDNSVNPDKYSFIKDRNVKSFISVPLQVKGKAHGLILIEHNIPNAFGEDNVRLLEIITQQISIAIENAKLYEQLQEYANTDGLTQIYNRVFFQNRLYEELTRATKQGYEVSIILFDIDDFKIYNDTYGHLFGDTVLQSIAMTVRESIRKDDIVARFGGEEFVVLLPHTGKETAYEKAEELRKKISELVVCDSNNSVVKSVSVSMGVSTFPTLAKNQLELINSADEGLYMAKKQGKNCVAIAEPSETNLNAEA